MSSLEMDTPAGMSGMERDTPAGVSSTLIHTRLSKAESQV